MVAYILVGHEHSKLVRFKYTADMFISYDFRFAHGIAKQYIALFIWLPKLTLDIANTSIPARTARKKDNVRITKDRLQFGRPNATPSWPYLTVWNQHTARWNINTFIQLASQIGPRHCTNDNSNKDQAQKRRRAIHQWSAAIWPPKGDTIITISYDLKCVHGITKH